MANGPCGCHRSHAAGLLSPHSKPQVRKTNDSLSFYETTDGFYPRPAHCVVNAQAGAGVPKGHQQVAMKVPPKDQLRSCLVPIAKITGGSDGTLESQ